jgi:hypothetical protein
LGLEPLGAVDSFAIELALLRQQHDFAGDALSQ